MKPEDHKALEEKSTTYTISLPRGVLVRSKFCDINISRFCAKALQLEAAQRLSSMILYNRQNKYEYEQFALKMLEKFQQQDAAKEAKRIAKLKEKIREENRRNHKNVDIK